MELKACPFCGKYPSQKPSKDISDGNGNIGFAVGCIGPSCLSLGPARNSVEAAKRAWNRRAIMSNPSA